MINRPPDFGQIESTRAEFLQRVWTDDAFRSRLEQDPRAVFAELGRRLPEHVEIRVVSDTETVKYLHIPSPPPENIATDTDLLEAQDENPAWQLALKSAPTSGR
ncbi:MAG: nitrile hydratase subunit alpha [Pseudomonadota bacterium]